MAAPANEIKWSVDQAQSDINFKVRHLLFSHVKGAFKTFDANIYTSGNDFTTAQIDLWIDTAAITTGDQKRDEYLKGPDFFDAAVHQQITFTSSKITFTNCADDYELCGNLSIKGSTQSVKLMVTFGGIFKDNNGNERASFSVTGKLNRSNWGLKGNIILETGGIFAADEIKVACEVTLIKAKNKSELLQLPTQYFSHNFN